MAALLALLAAVSWGSSDFLAGNASRRSSAVSVVILTHLASVIALVLVAVDFGPVWSSLSDLASGGGDDGVQWKAPRIVGAPTTTDMAWGLAAGLGGGLGAMLLFRGLGKGSMAVVAPVTAAGAAIIPVIAGLATGDPLSTLALAGIALALVAIVLVSLVAPDDAVAQDDTAADEDVTTDDPDDGSLTVPPGWVEEFRREHHEPNDGPPAGGLPAPVAAGRVAMPPPMAPTAIRALHEVMVEQTAPELEPVAVAAPSAEDDRADTASFHRTIRGLLRVIAALLLALVGAAVWIALGTIADVDGELAAAEIGALALGGLMVMAATIAAWATLPLLRAGPVSAEATDARTVDVAAAPGASGRRSLRGVVSQPGLPEALLSGVGFGLFFVFIYRTSESAGQWPLLGARSVSVVMFTIAALVTSTSVLPAAGSRLAVVWAGLFDAIAAILFVVATRAGSLSVAAVLASLYPAITVLLARVVTKEQIRPIQIAGLALALGAVGLLAI